MVDNLSTTPTSDKAPSTLVSLVGTATTQTSSVITLAIYNILALLLALANLLGINVHVNINQLASCVLILSSVINQVLVIFHYVKEKKA